MPSFAADGKIAYTVDKELRDCRRRGQTTLRRSRWTTTRTSRPFRQTAQQVAYNDSEERIRVLDLATGLEVTR